MFNSLTITLSNSNSVLLQHCKEINPNNLDNLLNKLKSMKVELNGLLKNMVNSSAVEPDGKEVGVDDEDEGKVEIKSYAS